MKQKVVIKRKRGSVSGVHVEINHSQFLKLSQLADKFGMTKSTAISQALNIWFGMIERQGKDKGASNGVG